MKVSLENKVDLNQASTPSKELGKKSNCYNHPVIDNSSKVTAQAKLNDNLFGSTIQRDELDEEELMQGKFVTQQKPDENEIQSSDGNTGIPANVQAKMESAFNTGFSNVKVHSNSSKATEVGALAYTQGSDIHFAPGQYNPSSTSGQQLLGHELSHVVQQSEGRVKPTGEVGGLPLNDDPSLEKEADLMGQKSSK